MSGWRRGGAAAHIYLNANAELGWRRGCAAAHIYLNANAGLVGVVGFEPTAWPERKQ